MLQPDYEKASQYALERLERELPPTLTYHSVAHTRDDVLPAVRHLAEIEGIVGEDMLLVMTAAWYHDLGFIEQRLGHEDVSIRIVREVLPGYNYSASQIDIISQIIFCTKLTVTPNSHLEAIMADADLDSLGRDDFLITSHSLRIELAAFGTVINDEDWYRQQIGFLNSIDYYTETARQLREPGKQANIRRMEALLEESRRPEIQAMKRRYEKARTYALERLERDLPPELHFHSLWHTRDDVVPATHRLASMEGISGEDLYLLLTAAWYHDLGYVEGTEEHEFLSMGIAGRTLPLFGYTPEQIDIINGIIQATRLPQTPQTHLEKVMADADMDNVGRVDFLDISERLRDEWHSLGDRLSDEEWYAYLYKFIKGQRFFTRAAKALRERVKQRNLEVVMRLLDETRRHDE